MTHSIKRLVAAVAITVCTTPGFAQEPAADIEQSTWAR